MRRYIVILIVGSFMIFCFSCKSSKIPTQSLLDPGWKAFNYPRTNFAPGYVFRIRNGENVQQSVTTLHSTKPIDTGYVFLPTEYQKKTFSQVGLLQFLSLPLNDTVLNAIGNQTFETSIDVGKALSESIDEPTINDLVTKSGIHWLENSKYYIIQSTLSAKQIKYKLSKNTSFNLGSLAGFKTIKPSITFSKSTVDSTSLVQDFDMYYRLFYTAIEINPMGAGISNEKKFTYRKVTIAIIND